MSKKLVLPIIKSSSSNRLRYSGAHPVRTAGKHIKITFPRGIPRRPDANNCIQKMYSYHAGHSIGYSKYGNCTRKNNLHAIHGTCYSMVNIMNENTWNSPNIIQIDPEIRTKASIPFSLSLLSQHTARCKSLQLQHRLQYKPAIWEIMRTNE